MDMENAIENKLEELMPVINEIRNDAHALPLYECFQSFFDYITSMSSHFLNTNP